MIKITAIVEYCPPRLGSDRRIFELLTRLPGNIKIDFVVFPPSRSLLGLLPFPQVHRKDNSRNIKNEVTAHYLSLPTLLRLMWRYYILGYILTIFYVFLKASKTLRKIDPDIVIINHPSVYTGLLGLFLGKISRKNIILDFNDMIADYTTDLLHESAEQRSRLHVIQEKVIKRLLTLIQNWIAINADLVLAPSASIIEHAKKVGIDSIHFLSNGVDTSIFDPAKYHEKLKKNLRRKCRIEHDEKLVVYVGRLDEWAGTSLVLNCVKKLEKNRQIKFLFVGEGQYERACVTSNIIFGGIIPYQSVPEYLAAADLVLVPMQHDVVGNAANPIKLFEAMAMMKPVIASGTKCIREIVNNNEEAILLPPNEEAWLQAILYILRKSSVALKLGAKARRKVESEFDWNVLALKLGKLLTQLSNHSKKKTKSQQIAEKSWSIVHNA